MGKGLQEICEAAVLEGRQIDLTGCFYEVSGPYAFVPCTYYPLLAGLARTQRMSQVLDGGTRYGGSILAVRKGLAEPHPDRPVLVTVDLTEHQGHALQRYPEIRRILGDGAAAAIVARVAKCFEPPIDMVFLDAVHTMEHTRACFEGYGRSLNPRFIVLDDIHLNASMARLWKELQSRFPADQVFDATEVAGRRSDCGFGGIEDRRGSRP